MIRALYSAAAVVTRTVCALDPSQPIPGIRDWEIIETPATRWVEWLLPRRDAALLAGDPVTTINLEGFCRRRI
jgi:hypothetical protein